MRIKNKHQTSTTSNARTPSKSRSSTGIVDAVLIAPPDLSFYLKLQNLLNYFVDCMNSLTGAPDKHAECSEHITRCISMIDKLDITLSPAIDKELKRMLVEFTEDAKQFQKMLKLFSQPSLTRTADETSAVLLTAKASHLQWLSVCILEDLKRSCSQA